MYCYLFGEKAVKIPGKPYLQDWSQVKLGVKNGILTCEFPDGLYLEFMEQNEDATSEQMVMFASRPIDTDYPNNAWVDDPAE